MEGVVPVTESHVSPGTLSADDTVQRGKGWSGGRIAAVVIGGLLAQISLGLLGAGGTAVWADQTQRDDAGYVTSDVE